MPVWALYLITVAIWGTSWYGIKEQLGVVAPTVSIAYRFFLAVAILWTFCVVTRRPLRFQLRHHGWMALQGLCLFCGNYILFYFAGMHLVSGLLAVCFSTISVMNVVIVWILFRRPLDRNAGLAALVGLAGIALVFYPKLMEQNARADAMLGLGLSMLATFLASLGNMVSVKLKALEIPVVQSNTIGMTYGAILCTVFSVAMGAPFNYDFRPGFSISLVMLALFASIFGFGAYLTLVQKIGAARAGYTSVIFPIIALLLSTLLEGYRWTPLAGLGLVLVLSGNLILLLKRKPAAPIATPEFQKGQTG